MPHTQSPALDLPAPGTVTFVGAGPGDADHLTLRAHRAIGRADVVIHDRLVAPGVLALAGAGARRIAVGKEGFGPSTPQAEINATIVAEAAAGHRVVRLKGGDPGIFARLDEEIETLERAGIGWTIVPGLTAASVAAAAIGQSLTKRGRNAALRIVTGHDMAGFAEQDWRGLARSGEVAAIYMARRSARFLQGRLLMHGAAADTPVTVVENAGRPEENIVAARLSGLPEAVAGLTGPAILLYGLAPRPAVAVLPAIREASA